jgi:5-methylcytosine-specific restriction endonuclease McrA
VEDCDEEDCLFYETQWCTDCTECTYCGRHIDLRNRHMDHVRAHSSGGVKIVPVCNDCNWSKGNKGFVSWLKWLHDNDKSRYQRIADYHFEKTTRPMADFSGITKNVSEVDWENYSWWARLRKWWRSS